MRKGRQPVLLLVLTLGFLVRGAVAATLIWNDATSSWFTPGNWTPAGPPSASDDAQIDNGGTAQILGPGATVNILNIGTFAGNSGTLQVGATGTLVASGFLGVGNSGNGTLSISSGGTVANTQGFIGFGANSVSAATVTGAGSMWTNSSTLTIGDVGTGTLNVLSGGLVSDSSATLGVNVGASGTAVVNGANSKWTNSFSLTIGDQGTGLLNIGSGGVVTNMGGTIANAAGSTGDVIVTGADSKWTMSGLGNNLKIGESGTGTLLISLGGVVTDDNGIIAHLASSTGAVTVSNTDSTWTNGQIFVGDGGTGTLNVTLGGLVTDNNGLVGGEVTGIGTVTVDGAASKWTNAFSLVVGNAGTGTLNITNGGVVTSTTSAIIADNPASGSNPASTGIVTVNGVGSMFINAADIIIGNGGNGTLSIQNGGAVSSFNGLIGNAAGSIGHATVEGTGSTWTNTGVVRIGSEGAGTLDITNGGAVSNTTGFIATLAGSTGTVTVDGIGSTWTNSNALHVGREGVGILNITNGGKVTNTNAVIGESVGSTGTATVDGAGSMWTNSSLLEVGQSGTGTLNITNSGLVTTTATTIGNLGTAIVDARLISPTVAINGGTLAGIGLVSGDVTNAGVVSPGHAPGLAGTLTIDGNYVQQTAGDMASESGGLSAGVTSDLLHLLGTATIDGTLHVIRLDNFTPMISDRVTILRSDAVRTGTFADVIPVNWPGLIQPMADYSDPMTVDIIFTLSGTFASQALTPNQRAVAHELDEVMNDSRAAELINFLGFENLANLPHDYDLIAPEELASLYEISISQAVVQNNNLQRRMDDIRAGSNGFCAEGFQIRETQGFSKGSDGKTVLDKNPAPYMQPSPDNRWGVFVTGFGEFVDVGNEDFNARGFEITNAGFTLGVDYRVCDNFAVGLNAGYAHSWADLVDRGRVTVDGGKIGAYATWFSGGFHVDGAISGGFNDYDTVRTGLQDLPVRGSTNGAELNGLFAIGYDFRFGCLNVGPIMTVQYTYVNIEGFTETGSLAPLEIQDQTEDSVRGTLGLRAAYDWKAGNGIIIRPEVRAAWQHEYDERAYPIDARFASGAGDVFTVRGPDSGRNSALVGGGVAVQWNNRISTYVYYDGVLGRENYESHNISGGLRVSF